MLAKRRLSVALAAVLAGAGWAVFGAPGSHVAAAPADGTTVRASVHDGTNAQAPDSSYHSQMSGDGTQVAFVGQDNLTDTYDNGCCTNAVYVRDLTTGRTVQISVGTEQLPSGGLAPNGDAPDGSSDYPSISDNGRYVSFVTQATNIVPHDDSFPLVIVVCDRDPDNDGVFDEQRANSPPGVLDYRYYEIAVMNGINNDNRFPDGFDSWPRLSGDASHIVWAESDSTQRVVKTAPLEQNDGSIGAPTTVYTLPTTLNNQTGADLDQPQISDDGVYIVARWTHVSTVTTTAIVATFLSPDGSPNQLSEIDASDTTPGAFQGAGNQANPPTRAVELPDISNFGSVAVFDSYPLNDQTSPQAYSVAPFSGEGSETLQSTLISKPSGGGTGDGLNPVVSADGRYAAFVTDRGGVTDAVQPGSQPDDTCINDTGDDLAADIEPCQIAVRDLVVDAQRAAGNKSYLPAQLASASKSQDCGSDLPANAVCPGDFDSALPSLSSDGGNVAFQSDADDLTGDPDTNRNCVPGYPPCYPGTDVFVRTWTPGLVEPNLHVGHVHVGDSKGVRYTIKATGFGPQGISNVRITPLVGSGFSVDDSGCSTGSSEPFVLHEGETCSVVVLFAPTGEGLARGALDVVTSGAGANPAAVITGTGTPPHKTKVFPHEIVRTSVSDGDPGGQADTGTFSNSMVSGNGDYDVFVSPDPLDGRPTHGFENVYVRNLRTDTTQQISLKGLETAPNSGVYVPGKSSPDDASFDPTISADGRYVSFVTDATDVAGEGTAETVVVCDRDPDGDGVFDERQPGHPGRPAFRCIDVQNEPKNFEIQQDPRLAPDGHHLVYIDCTKPGSGICAGQLVVELVQLRTSSQGLQPVQDTDRLRLTPDEVGSGGQARLQPQVSDQGLFGDPHSVRVAYAAQGDVTSGIFVVNVTGGQSGTPRRIDFTPGGTGFLGDNDTPQVADPSMTDDGSMVAFDQEGFDSESDVGVARAYIATVAEDGRAKTRPVATIGKTPVRAADPALSGDGRYVSYVTDQPNFDNTPQTDPDESCLGTGSAEFVSLAAPNDGICQIVARDLVADRKNANQGVDPLPDALVTESGKPCAAATVFGSTCGGDNGSYDPSMSFTGSEVGFDSFADDLVPNDTNPVDTSSEGGGQDAFVRTFFPKAALTPVHFGNVPVGTTASQASTLTITGFGPYQLAGATVAGADPGDFTVTGGTCALPGQLLHIYEMCDLNFTFTPGAAGPRSATVTVSGDNNPNTTTITVTGKGANTNTPMFTANPNPLRFGSGLPLDQPGRSRLLKITNPGGSPLMLSQITVIDSSVPGAAQDYTVDVSACTLGVIEPGHSCTLRITWVGHAVGPRPAILRVVDNAPGGIQVVGLRASVPVPAITMTPSVVPTGHLTQVTGHGFAPHRRVLITLPDAGGSAIGRTNKHGKFTTALVTFPNGITGHLLLHARSAHADKSISAQKKLLVTLGTLQSPTLVIRH